MSLDAIKQKLTNLKPELHMRFGVSEVGVFGSWVRGEQKDTSDIDVLVDFDWDISLFDLVDLQEFLQEQIPLNVDIALKRSLKKYIGRQILQEVQYL